MGSYIHRPSAKLLLLFFLFFTMPSSSTWSQCAQFIQGDTIMAPCGDSVTLEVESDSLFYTVVEDFNDQALDSPFVANMNLDYSNPCPPSPDSTPYAWFGPAKSSPRILKTLKIDVDSVPQVCFDFYFAEENGSGSPCEGPDLPDEGVYFQYSVDGGATWNDIFFFNPDTNNSGGSNSIFNSWDRYCFSIPPAAQTDSTRFRWYQPMGSGADFDHWGLDDIRFHKDSGQLAYDWGNGLTSKVDSTLLPSDSSTYSVTVIDTVENDTCQASAYVGYKDLNVVLGPTDPVVCAGDSLQLYAQRESDSCSYTLDLQDSYGDGWDGASVTVYLNGDSIGTFSASGFGSVIDFNVHGSDQVALEYNSGAFDSENSYILIGPSGDTLFQDGPSPTGGLVYSQSAQCSGDSTLSYDWSPGAGLSDSTIQDPVTGTDTPTTYYLMVQHPAHAFCSDTDTITVDTADPANVSLGPDTSFCMKNSLVLTPSPNFNYPTWNDSIVQDSLVVDTGFGIPTQEHWVTVMDSNGCHASDTVLVTVLDTPSVSLGTDTNLCPEDSIVLDPGTYSSYLWDDSSTTQLHPVEAPDSGQATHFVEVWDSSGCKGTSTISITSLPTPSIDLGPDTTLCADSSITLSTSYNNPLWDDGSSSSSHFLDTSQVGLGSSQHWVEAENDSGCKGSDTVTVTFTICSSLPEQSEEGSLKVLPNPVSEKLRIRMKERSFQKGSQLRLFDAKGRKVLEKAPRTGSQRCELDVSDLSPGTYFLHFEQEGRIYRKKLLVE